MLGETAQSAAWATGEVPAIARTHDEALRPGRATRRAASVRLSAPKGQRASPDVSAWLEFYGLRNACVQLCRANTAWNAAQPSRWAFTSR